MRLLTKVYVKDVLGLDKHEKGAEELAQSALRKWVSKCGCKKQMRGGGAGATVLPMNYFGVEGAGYVEGPVAGTPTAPTAEWLRPTIPETFTRTLPAQAGGSCSICTAAPASLVTGGAAAPKFTVAMTTFKGLVKSPATEAEIKAKKAKFEALFEKALKKAARMDKANGKNVLTRSSLEKVISSEKQFASFM
jgi:hypothetical protein